MDLNEKEVYISRDGEGRAAIVERNDGLFCIYVHWIWPESGGRQTWVGDSTPREILYDDKQRTQGIYGTVEDARKEIMGAFAWRWTTKFGEPNRKSF